MNIEKRNVNPLVAANESFSDEQYRVLKVCTTSKDGILLQQAKNEIAVLGYLKSSPVQQHPGKALVRTVLGSFDIAGAKGLHTCLVYQPLGMTFTEMRNLLPEGRIEQRMLQHALQLILLALDYLHKNNVVHTGTHSILKPTARIIY